MHTQALLCPAAHHFARPYKHKVKALGQSIRFHQDLGSLDVSCACVIMRAIGAGRMSQHRVIRTFWSKMPGFPVCSSSEAA